MKFLFLLLAFISFAEAKPYHKPFEVELPTIGSTKTLPAPSSLERIAGLPVLRVEVQWNTNETFQLSGLFLEESGTPALIKSAQKRDPLGSYKGTLAVTTNKGRYLLHSSIGTGREYRQLVRVLSFRFPIPDGVTAMAFAFEAEHPQRGTLEKIFATELNLQQVVKVQAQTVKPSLLRKALKEPALIFNFYAEGFDHNGEQKFLSSAQKAIATFEKNLPASDHFQFQAVFAPSKLKIGSAKDRGPQVQIQDSFLGLYFPHWRKFGRWYHVVYPTSETKYRNSLAQLPYDYALALVDDGEYWGVGNYKELTAIPAGSFQFSYLLLHEFGHFMGLNEEYEGGGPTELEFAVDIKEPWSQNITFNPNPVTLKWLKLTEPGISIPTSNADYRRFGGETKNPVGAYRGGYADSLPKGKSHKPVMKCMMGAGGNFCPVCQDALLNLVKQDLGI